jgi:ABC-2 type transport system permease protein
MIWAGTWIGMKARSADAVQGIVFVVIFPLTFVSNAFVPVQSMPDALQWVASWNPISAIVAAVLVLFGNPTTPVTKEVWPTMHAVAAAWIYTILILAIAVPAAIRLHRARTTD